MTLKLTRLLTLFILVSSIAWPVQAYMHGEKTHSHDEGQYHSQELVEQANADQKIADTKHSNHDDSSACDHCCHFASHSTGVLEDRSYHSIPQHSSTFNQYRISFSSFILSPPFHPPIA